MPKLTADQLAGYSDAKLASEIHRLSAERDALREASLAIHAELDRRVAAARVAALSDAERSSLAQAIRAEGIPSGEQVGKA